MKVIEKNTDRKAEIHAHVAGKLKALEDSREYFSGASYGTLIPANSRILPSRAFLYKPLGLRASVTSSRILTKISTNARGLSELVVTEMLNLEGGANGRSGGAILIGGVTGAREERSGTKSKLESF